MSDNRLANSQTPPAIFVGNKPLVSGLLARRLKSAYLCSAKTFISSGSSMWAEIRARQQTIHNLLIGDDENALAQVLSHPAATDLLYGMDDLHYSSAQLMRQLSVDQLRAFAESIWLIMVKMAEAIGVRRAWNQEQPTATHAPSMSYDVDGTLALIDHALGVHIDFPNPFPGELGLGTSRGVISRRSLDAIYQAQRLQQLSKTFGHRLVEIGAGLGRTAYYANLLGLDQYTIIDLPMSNLAQGLFLGTVIGDLKVRLSGEERSGSHQIEIFSHPAAEALTGVDVVLNADSLTEMHRVDAERYVDCIKNNVKVFLSINHEVNEFRVSEIGNLAKYRVSRHQYWPRPGYVEEVYVF